MKASQVVFTILILVQFTICTPVHPAIKKRVRNKGNGDVPLKTVSAVPSKKSVMGWRPASSAGELGTTSRTRTRCSSDWS